jgi:mono/diheme cytochrome c family protein
MNETKYIRSALLIIAICLFCFLVFKMLFSVELTKKEIGPQIQPENKGVGTALSQQGKLIYNNNCLACHGSFSADDGPWLSLAGYPNRWLDKKELFAFVRNPDSIMKVSTYAKELTEKFGVRMKGSPNLSDQEIESIFSFIENEKAGKETP